MERILEIAVTDLTNTRYLTFAALAILLYDHRKPAYPAVWNSIDNISLVITIVDEVTLIWPAKVGPKNFLPG